MRFNKNGMLVIATILLGAASFNQIRSEVSKPLGKCYVLTRNSTTIYINRWDYDTGIETTIDSIDTTNPAFPLSAVWTRDIEWSIYDPIHRRLYFQEALTDVIIRTHVYELDTDRYFNLPYDNFMGQHVEMVISPNSEYIIFTYMHARDSIWSPELYKTVVLDGDNLNQLAESVGLTISEINLRETALITGNNRYMFNWTFVQVSDSTREHAYIIYSLPDLIAMDTVFHSQVGWNGAKTAYDYSENGLLFIGNKPDSSRDLPSGTYAFIVNAPEGNISSRFIRIADGGHFDARLSPDGEEIVLLYSDRGMMRRYSLQNGRQIGQTDVPMGTSFQFGFFGTDGNLYLGSPGREIVVVDYRNNRIDRTFRFARGE